MTSGTMARLTLFLILGINGLFFIDAAKEQEENYPPIPLDAKLKWKRLEFAQFEANTFDKPVLFFMGKTWCRKCHQLVQDMMNNEEFVTESQKFVMAKAVDDEVPVGPKYALDGKYVPKIVFEDSKGHILKKFVNEDSTNSSHKYYYKNAEEVLKTMRLVLERGSIAQGFGNKYDWKEYNDGLEIAKVENKPVMLVIHQDWCGACQRLKPKFANSTLIQELSQNFVMINSDEDEVAKSKEYDVDGEYYPRIVFLEPTGKMMPDMWNIGTKHKHVKFYYGEEEEIVASMRRVMELSAKSLDRGFGKHIQWVTFNTAHELAKEQKKPMMMIIHKSYCGACKALKARIRKHKRFGEMAKNFIMVNLEDDEEPDDPQYDIDGAYVPRIFFVDSHGIVEPTLKNEEDEFKKVKYAYGKIDTLVNKMQQALDMNLGTRDPPQKEEQKEEEKQEETGFAGGYEWIPVENAAKEARKSHRAIMYVIHSGWCLFSKALREQFKTSAELKEMSKRFVMVNIQDDKEDVPDKFDIDGKYTTRILFAGLDGMIKREINNTMTTLEPKFYYASVEEIIAGMNLASSLINTDLSRGFGEHLEWQTYAKGKEIAKREGKPMFVLIHRTWCAACKALKPVIANSWDISQLRVHFVMVNIEDDEEPEDNQFRVDGGYYPRLFILDSNAKVVRELHNDDPKYIKYKFSYSYESQVVTLMNKAYRHFGDLTKAASSPPSQNPQIRTDPALQLNARSHQVGFEEAKNTNKPIMLLIHRKTCPACKAVHRMLGRDEDFKRKAQNFVLIDIEDDSFPDVADTFDVDGTYVPRIYFLDPEGNIWKDIWNVGTQYQTNKFYYYETVSVLRQMDKALKAFQDYKEQKNQGEESTTKASQDVKEEL